MTVRRHEYRRGKYINNSLFPLAINIRTLFKRLSFEASDSPGPSTYIRTPCLEYLGNIYLTISMKGASPYRWESLKIVSTYPCQKYIQKAHGSVVQDVPTTAPSLSACRCRRHRNLLASSCTFRNPWIVRITPIITTRNPTGHTPHSHYAVPTRPPLSG